MTDAPKSHPFWTTLPGVLTGVAAVLTALVGLLALFMTGGDETVSSPSLPPAGSTSGGPEASPGPSPSGATASGSAEPPPPGSPASVGEADDEYLLFRGSKIDVDSGQSGSGVTGEELAFVNLGYVHVYGERHVRVPEVADGPGCADALSRGVDDDTYHPDAVDDGLVVCVRTDKGSLARLDFGPEDDENRLFVKVTRFS